MGTGAPPSGSAAAAWRRAAAAYERAARADALAEHYEARALATGSRTAEQIAVTHRRTAACHRSSAQFQESYARRLSRWTQDEGAPPRFMTGVADACGTASAALTLVGTDHAQLAVAASDEPSRAAQDLEYVLGEGPSRDAATGIRPITASGHIVEERWPGFGPAMTALGFAEVVAVPLRTSSGCLGALAVFDPRPGLATPGVLAEVAEALVRSVLLGPDADPELYGGTDHRESVHQAAGMASVQARCSVADALALIKARAYTDGVPVNDIARRLMRGELRLA